VHLNLPIRPPADPWVEPPDEEGLMRAVAILGDTAHILYPSEGEFDLGQFDNIVDAVVALIKRHPMRRDELERTLTRWQPERVAEALEQLRSSEEVQVLTRYGHEFWSCAGARYVERAGDKNPLRAGCK
jgi:hypothetical protein